MRISIRNKLIASYLLLCTFTALSIYVLTYFTSEQRVNALALDYQMQEISQEVINWYIAEQGWEGFEEYFKTLHPVDSFSPPPEMREAGGPPPKRHGIVTDELICLIRYLHYLPGDKLPKAFVLNATPVEYQDKVIAWIIPADSVGISFHSQMKIFLDNIREVLLIAIYIGIFLSLLMGVLLAKILLKPVEYLNNASSAIAKGELLQQVPTYTNDEIGDLSRTFNKMSQDLAKADQQRRRLTADIAHDLGTPLQVIAGYIEMAQSGRLELNSERITMMAEEIDHIIRLLDDMNLLAETDTKTLSLQLAPTDIKPLLQHVVRLYQQPCQEKRIKLKLKCPNNLPELKLDNARMLQILGNLVSNAIRYTPKFGEIIVSAKQVGLSLEIQVKDTGSGIKQDQLPFIFDRFYRGDNSRNQASGKMGFGLSIAKGLVEMQLGSIRVESDGVTGTQFFIRFPISKLK